MNNMHVTVGAFAPPRLSSRVDGLKLSEIVRISEDANRLIAAGHDIVVLSTGEPDFPTPPHVIEAAIAAMHAGQTLYTPTAGTIALRRAIGDTAAGALGVTLKPDQIIVSNGAKQVLSNALMATLNAGDEVVVPAPSWTSYADMITVAGGEIVNVVSDGKDDFKIKPDQLAAALTSRTRWVLLNSPCNPTGAMYTQAELAALAEVLRQHPHVWIMSDEIYGQISYQPFVPFTRAAPDLAARTLIVSGVSKAYAMTGWRIGWGIGAPSLIAAMVAIQGQSTSGASSISQAAALAALTGPQDTVALRAEIFRRRRDLVVRMLKEMPGLDCAVPDGAFYVFPGCHALLGKVAPDGVRINDDADFCAYLLRTEGVAVVPGRAFSLPGYFRLSFAYAEASLREGCARIARAVEKLQ